MKRAIALAGGGPAAGLHIGVLEHLDKIGVKFDVWALSCIGAWVGIVYNQAEAGREAEQTYAFFRDHVFRDDVSYSGFPVNSVFGTNWAGYAQAYSDFLLNPEVYKTLVLPDAVLNSCRETAKFLSDPNKWTVGDYNQWVHNHVLAVNPAVRFWTSLMFLSGINGLSRIYYPDSEFMRSIKFEKLYEKDKPYIFHNAWNLTKQNLEIFSNKNIKDRNYKRIDAASLCACSALPYVEETVDIDGDTYCEGALVDTVNFRDLLVDHPDLDEIWISRIVDAHQIRKPRNLHDSLANLCQLFAATVGEDDVKLFEYHVQHTPPEAGQKKWTGTIIELRVSSRINFHWDHENLENGREQGRLAAQAAVAEYLKITKGRKNDTGKVRIIKASPEEDVDLGGMSPHLIDK